MTTGLQRVYAVLFDNPNPADACVQSISNNITNYTARHQLHTDSVRLKRVHDQLQDVRNFLEHEIKKESDDAQKR